MIVKSRNHFPAVLFTLSLVANVLLPIVGQAHDFTGWYSFRWRDGARDGVTMDTAVDWDFVDNFPTSDGAREAVKAAAYEWTKQTAAMRFNHLDPHSDYNLLDWESNCPATPTQVGYQKDRVGWGQIGPDGFQLDTDALAITALCTFPEGPYTLYSFKIKVNEDAPWYFSGDNVPDGKWDLEATLAHEFGHATGRSEGGPGNSGHFDDSWDVCPDKYDANEEYRHTMCPAIPDGRKTMRSLEQHDVDTFKNAYPL